MRRFYGVLADVPAIRFFALAFTYAAAMTFTLWVAYQLRFDFHVPANVQQGLAVTMTWIILLKLAVLVGFGQFQDSLSYFGAPDMKRILAVCVVSSLIIFLTSHYGGLAVAPPKGVAFMDFVFSCVVLCIGRVGLRFLREQYLAPRTRTGRRAQRVAIIGAGDTGAALVRELLGKEWLGLRPVAFFDDFRSMRSRVHGIPVWGPPERLLDAKVAQLLDEVIIALPSARTGRLRSIVKLLQQAKMPFRTIPSLSQLAIGTVSVTNLRPVVIEDLLGRDVVRVEAENVRRMLEGRTVLVTGAGGSIGSELCRQIASFNPRVLLMVERCEASLFPIEQELIERGFRDLIVPLVADVTDLPRMEGIFSRFRPHAVFHAAAHKHVPMMESQPAEAIRNNALGTAGLAKLAYVFQVERFLLISTDKAINPTNVMGATKRMAEIFVQSMQTRNCSPAKFMAVRFGNVLGSSGSVVPVFARQIAAGGPVKVTHPEITRYFMIIPEAVSLVLQSAARAGGGEIFVLDMGKPVKIADLARQMIELSGLTPGADIEIEFTGLRPGEKLYEELSHQGEDVTPTDHPKILRFVSTPVPYERIKSVLQELEAALMEAEPHELKLLLHKTIPEYTPEIKDKGVEPATESGIRGFLLPSLTQ